MTRDTVAADTPALWEISETVIFFFMSNVDSFSMVNLYHTLGRIWTFIPAVFRHALGHGRASLNFLLL